MNMPAAINFEIRKIKNRDLDGDIESLLRRVGLVEADGKQAHPELLYMSKIDCQLLRRAVARRNKIRIKDTGWVWLNLGPNQSLAEVIQPGYMLIVRSDK
jgi:hypothetical protein